MSELQKRVQVAIDDAVDAGSEIGVQVAVYRHGVQVVDAVAGLADAGTGRPMTPDTPVYAASAVKAAASTVAHVLAERGAFTYDTLVVDVWPEYGVHGKEATTLRHILTHSAGVPAVPADITPEQLCDWDHMVRLIADLVPKSPPGERVAYHTATFGYLIGEFVRRATGSRISEVLAEEVAGPIGMADELFFAVPPSRLPRLARLVDDPEGKAMFASLPPDFPLFSAVPRSIIPNAELANRTDLLTAEIPYHGVVSARGLARMYAALMGPVDGVRLIGPARLAEATTLATAGMEDETTGGPSPWALGYCVGGPGPLADRPSAFGMVGIGGSAAYADRSSGIAFAVTKNKFNPSEMNVVDHVAELVVEAYS